jgi:hypothetical protein
MHKLLALATLLLFSPALLANPDERLREANFAAQAPLERASLEHAEPPPRSRACVATWTPCTRASWISTQAIAMPSITPLPAG